MFRLSAGNSLSDICMFLSSGDRLFGRLVVYCAWLLCVFPPARFIVLLTVLSGLSFVLGGRLNYQSRLCGEPAPVCPVSVW